MPVKNSEVEFSGTGWKSDVLQQITRSHESTSPSSGVSSKITISTKKATEKNGMGGICTCGIDN